MKKIITIALALALLVSMTTTALAAPPLTYSSVPTEGTPASGNVGSAQGQLSMGMMPMTDSIHIYTWRNSISEVSSGYLSLYGLTATDLLADKVETDYYLQQWNGTSWVTYSTSTNYAYSTDYLSLNVYKYVTLGYYYRLETVHKGWLGATYDSKTLYSSYIYVD